MSGIISEESMLVSKSTGAIMMDVAIGSKFVDPFEIARRREFMKGVYEPQERDKHGEYSGRRKKQFVWIPYKLNGSLMPELSPYDFAVISFLGTYTSYSGKLEKAKNYTLDKTQLRMTTGMEKSQYRKYILKMRELGLMEECEDGGYTVGNGLFTKGTIPKSKIKENEAQGIYYTKLYCTGIRGLYNETLRKDATITKTNMGYCLKLIPYLNRHYNVLCLNPLEAESERLQPMTYGDICTAIGWPKARQGEIGKLVETATFSVRGRREYVFRKREITYAGKRRHYEIYMNPNLVRVKNNIGEIESRVDFTYYTPFDESAERQSETLNDE